MPEAELVDSVPQPVPADTTPSPEAEAPQESTPAPEEAPASAEPAADSEPTPAPETYTLPDGRQVDGETLAREWKENFYPEYTRKSQRLAEIERAANPNLNSPADVPEWQRPDYVPKSYAEIIQIAETRALERIREEAGAEERARAEFTAQVDQQVTAIKAKDANLDENALFQHATKYRFTDLMAAYENMSEMKKVARSVEERTLKNVSARKADPVAGGGTPAAPGGDAVSYGAAGKYSGALEYLRSIQH